MALTEHCHASELVGRPCHESVGGIRCGATASGCGVIDADAQHPEQHGGVTHGRSWTTSVCGSRDLRSTRHKISSFSSSEPSSIVRPPVRSPAARALRNLRSALTSACEKLKRPSADTVGPHPMASNPVLCWRAASILHGCKYKSSMTPRGYNFGSFSLVVWNWNWMTGKEPVVRLILFLFCLSY